MYFTGFAYFPDGAHKGVDELEPSISLSNSSCQDSNTCQAPMYFRNDFYLGDSFNNLGSTVTGGINFGLSDYENMFHRSRTDWINLGKFSVKLNLTDEGYSKDIFYFCHLHDFMSGRIKILTSDGKTENRDEIPILGYNYETLDPFDNKCGTYGASSYRLDNALCDQENAFICNREHIDYTSSTRNFGECMEAIDCKMHVEMRTYLSQSNPTETFVHQMIPHHENAVNMPKIILKASDNGLNCETYEEDCEILNMMWEIINGQNHQITMMRNWLQTKGYAESDPCAPISFSPNRRTRKGKSALTTSRSKKPLMNKGRM